MDAHYDKAHVGLGLWDGKAAFQELHGDNPGSQTVDKAKLNAAIKEAEALKEADYTPDSWKALAAA